MKYLTYETLSNHSACHSDIAKLKAIWPDKIPLTMEALNQARAAGVCVFWARALLTRADLEEDKTACEQAWMEYAEVCQKMYSGTWVEYMIALRRAREKFELALDVALLKGLQQSTV